MGDPRSVHTYDVKILCFRAQALYISYLYGLKAAGGSLVRVFHRFLGTCTKL